MALTKNTLQRNVYKITWTLRS